jgi:hypothetical protein
MEGSSVAAPPVHAGHADDKPCRRHRRHHQSRDAVGAQAAIVTGGVRPDDGHTCGHAG